MTVKVDHGDMGLLSSSTPAIFYRLTVALQAEKLTGERSLLMQNTGELADTSGQRVLAVDWERPAVRRNIHSKGNLLFRFAHQRSETTKGETC